jgi:hypothetical protein
MLLLSTLILVAKPPAFCSFTLKKEAEVYAKHWYLLTKLYSVMYQKTLRLLVTGVRAANLALCLDNFAQCNSDF